MRDRLHPLLKFLPLALAGILAIQLVWAIARPNPVSQLEVPAALHWHPDEGTNPQPASASVKKTQGSEKPAASSETNHGTNRVTTNAASTSHGVVSTNQLPSTGGTNSTNQTPMAESSGGPSPPQSAGMPPAIPAGMPPGMMMMLMGGGAPGMPGPGSQKPPTPLPPLIQARIDKITQSELLAPVFHPPPMALLGIAGPDAFLRTPSGQTSLLREGGESDGIKLVRVGTNRVLIEQTGEKKELTIFEGLGGESLLPK